MAAAERHTSHEHEGMKSLDFRSQPFSLTYSTRPDTDKGVPSRNLTLDFREGSFSLKPEFAAPLHALCDTLKIDAPHCDHDLPNFVRRCLYTVDEETYQERPHFENEVIPVLFPNGDLEARKVMKFLSSAAAPEKADQCCEIKGNMDGKKESVHLHGPYQADNKTRLTLLALVGYKPAQELLKKLVEKQPELRGKPLEQTTLTFASTIIQRKHQQEAEHHAHHHNHEHEHEHNEHEDHEPTAVTPKPLERFTLTEKIPSNELGVWEQSLKTVADAAVSLVLMQEQIDPKTKKELESTVTYRLGFSPDPRHLLPEEVALNRACDDAIIEHLQSKKDLIGNLSPEQLTQALLLMRSVRFGEEEIHHLTETLHAINSDLSQQTDSISELQPTLNYILKLGEQEVNFSYSQVLQVVALSMRLRAQKELSTLTSEEQKIMQLSSIFNDFGFTLSNFRSDANQSIQEHPYLLKPGQPLQQFEQAAVRNNPNALQAFNGADAHARGKDMMGLHGTIRMENGKLVQELCPDHTQQVTEQLQKVEQITQQLTQQFMQAIMEMPLPPVQSPPLAPFYPPPYLYDAPHLHPIGGIPQQHNLSLGMPYGALMSGFSSSMHGRSEGLGQSNSSRSEPANSHSSGLSYRSENSNKRDSTLLVSMTKAIDFRVQRPVIVETHRPRQTKHTRKVLVHEVLSGGKLPTILEGIVTTTSPEDASQRVFKTKDGENSPRPSLTLVREVQGGGIEKTSLRATSLGSVPEQAARVANVNNPDSVPLTFIQPVRSGGKPKEAVASVRKTDNPSQTVKTEYVNDGTPKLTLVHKVDSGGRGEASIQSLPKTDNFSDAVSIVYVNREPTPPLTFVRKVKEGGKPQALVRDISTTDIPSRAARTEYVSDGISRTFARKVNSGGVDRSSISNTPTTNNPSEAASIAYINNVSDRSGTSVVTKPELQPTTSIRPYRSYVSSVVSPSQSAPIDSSRSAEPIIPRFTTSSIDTGPRNPRPTRSNPNRSLNSGESVSRSVSKPVEVLSVTIGTNLSKAFEKVQEQQSTTETSTQSIQTQRSEQVQQSTSQETSVTAQTAQHQQQEQVAAAIGGTKQEKVQQKVSQKVEAGESFGTNDTNEVVEQSANSTTSDSTQEVQDKTETTQVTTAPATPTRQTRGSSNVTEAARITEVETPRGKVKIIEGGRTTGVSANTPQMTQTAAGSSDEEVVVAAVKGTDEQNEENKASDTQTQVQKQATAPVTNITNVTRVKQTGQTAAASLALRVDNEYLDFTNPHGIRDAFKKAWAQAVAA